MAARLGCQLGVLALAWLSLLLVTASCHEEQATNRLRALLQFSRFSPPYNVCTSDWAPIVMCADIEDPADFTGYQIALWREVAKDMGWSDADWTFTCMDWTEMIDDLVNPAGKCSFAAAGVEVSLPNSVLGLKFSWPIYKSGFQVLIASTVEEGGTWAFAGAFHYSVWIMLGATAIIVSMLITAVELLTFGNRANRRGIRGWSWYSMGKIAQIPTHVGDPKTWASRVLVLGYAFLVLIMMHLFTATTANKMTMQRLANDITSKADLPGKKVESWQPYVPLLRKYSIDAEGLPWDNDEDTAAMLNNLRTHAYQALILDSPVVQHFAAQAEQCDLYPVGDPFETFNLAIAFPPDAPHELSMNVSASIVRLQSATAILDELDNFYVKGEPVNIYTSWKRPDNGRQSCQNAFADTHDSGRGASNQIHLDEVAGLWYIQGFALAIAIIVTVVLRIKHAISPPRVQPVQWDQAHVRQSDVGSCPRTSDEREPANAVSRKASRLPNLEQLASGCEEDCVAQVSLPSGSNSKVTAQQQQHQQQQRVKQVPLSATGVGGCKSVRGVSWEGQKHQQQDGDAARLPSSEPSVLTARRVELTETPQQQQQQGQPQQRRQQPQLQQWDGDAMLQL